MKKSLIANRIYSFMAFCLVFFLATADTIGQLLDMDNTRVNDMNYIGAQYDPTVVINLCNPQNAVIIWQDMALSYPRVGYAYTNDGGQSWSDALMNLESYPSQSEPSIAVDSNGNFYCCMIGSNTDGQTGRDIIILKTTDGGIQWSAPIVAVAGSPDYHDIMPNMTIDNTPFGSRDFIYVTWVRYEDDISSSLVYETQSDNNGQSFLDPVQLSDLPGALHPKINIRTAFGNGDVDVNWLQVSPRHAGWDFSVTEGWTFHNDTWLTVAGATAYDYEINGGIFVSTVMAEMGDNQSGSEGFEKAYLVYMDQSGLDMDISFSRITSHFDVTEFVDFSPRIALNDDGQGNGDQFMPSVAVDEQGVVHVAFYDRRNDPDNLLYDVYYTSSTDMGNTWIPNVRVTSLASDPSLPDVAGQIGNRMGIASWQNHTIVTWTDTRNGNTDIYASSLTETGIAEEESPLPENISLENPFPNPFNSSVEINFNSGYAQRIRVDVIDILGNKVKTLYDDVCQAGPNRLIWNGTNSDNHGVGSGTYFVKLTGGDQSTAKKAVLLK